MPSKKLSKVERAGLLKCRYATRYHALGRDGLTQKGTKEEYAEEQAASFVTTPRHVLESLIARGLAERTPDNFMIITDAGRAALGAK